MHRAKRRMRSTRLRYISGKLTSLPYAALGLTLGISLSPAASSPALPLLPVLPSVY